MIENQITLIKKKKIYSQNVEMENNDQNTFMNYHK